VAALTRALQAQLMALDDGSSVVAAGWAGGAGAGCERGGGEERKAIGNVR